MTLKFSEQQGLKRLKKVHPKGKLMRSPADSCTNHKPDRHCSPRANSKETSCDTPKERFFGGTTAPMPFKFRQSSAGLKMLDRDDLERMKSREHNRRNNFPVDVRKTMREPPHIEIGPKQLKVRGPLFPNRGEQPGSRSWKSGGFASGASSSA
ncbi:uncharacterized protein LOC122081310 [Macadamia integrifolia]|uniref:uncharacterized protein LOC122081310 n=1 Tax=Macadamia integrifolia TaxID=60698 RepID=UPI001C4EE6B8|nr:uncharacterized protein LOC122081310 [Macadamia integrifolia]